MSSRYTLAATTFASDSPASSSPSSRFLIVCRTCASTVPTQMPCRLPRPVGRPRRERPLGRTIVRVVGHHAGTGGRARPHVLRPERSPQRQVGDGDAGELDGVAARQARHGDGGARRRVAELEVLRVDGVHLPRAPRCQVRIDEDDMAEVEAGGGQRPPHVVERELHLRIRIRRACGPSARSAPSDPDRNNRLPARMPGDHDRDGGRAWPDDRTPAREIAIRDGVDLDRDVGRQPVDAHHRACRRRRREELPPHAVHHVVMRPCRSGRPGCRRRAAASARRPRRWPSG